jgi:hypothetical protein
MQMQNGRNPRNLEQEKKVRDPTTTSTSATLRLYLFCRGRSFLDPGPIRSFISDLFLFWTPTSKQQLTSARISLHRLTPLVTFRPIFIIDWESRVGAVPSRLHVSGRGPLCLAAAVEIGEADRRTVASLHTKFAVTDSVVDRHKVLKLCRPTTNSPGTHETEHRFKPTGHSNPAEQNI